MKAPKGVPLLANLLLAVFSTALVVAFIEFAMVPRVLQLLPLRVHAGLPRGFRLLAQSSKASTVPHGYIALAGDSHAQGLGDWFLEIDAARNPPFHSAHLIRDKTDRDVISFGAAGASSLRGLVTEPETTLGYLSETALLAVEPPDSLILYFYEGNDLNDNLADLAARFDPDYDRTRLRDPAYFREFLTEVVIGQSPKHLDRLDFGWTENLVMTHFVFRVIDAFFSREWALTPPEPEFSESKINHARVAGNDAELPDGLQAPALDLDEKEIDLALYVFEQAFDYTVERFPDTRIGVVYLPSPLSSYAITSDRVHIQLQQENVKDPVFPTGLLSVRSDRICNAVEKITKRFGASFVDLRPSLWKATDTGFVHGPRDWKHLNPHGQEVLAEGAVAALRAAERGEAGQSCASMQKFMAGRAEPSGS